MALIEHASKGYVDEVVADEAAVRANADNNLSQSISDINTALSNKSDKGHGHTDDSWFITAINAVKTWASGMFAEISHSHVMSEITGLVSALAGKLTQNDVQPVTLEDPKTKIATIGGKDIYAPQGGGSVTLDDEVTRTSANGVMSSGIWRAIWGTLTALPSGFISLYDWVVNALSGKLDKTDVIKQDDVGSLTPYGKAADAKDMNDALAGKLNKTDVVNPDPPHGNYDNPLLSGRAADELAVRNKFTFRPYFKVKIERQGSKLIWANVLDYEAFVFVEYIFDTSPDITTRWFGYATSFYQTAVDPYTGEVIIQKEVPGKIITQNDVTIQWWPQGYSVDNGYFVNNRMLADLLPKLAPAYSTSTTYAVDDFCSRGGVIYQCVAATSGAWDSSKWDERDLSSLFSSDNGSGNAWIDGRIASGVPSLIAPYTRYDLADKTAVEGVVTLADRTFNRVAVSAATTFVLPTAVSGKARDLAIYINASVAEASLSFDDTNNTFLGDAMPVTAVNGKYLILLTEIDTESGKTVWNRSVKDITPAA